MAGKCVLMQTWTRGRVTQTESYQYYQNELAQLQVLVVSAVHCCLVLSVRSAMWLWLLVLYTYTHTGQTSEQKENLLLH